LRDGTPAAGEFSARHSASVAAIAVTISEPTWREFGCSYQIAFNPERTGEVLPSWLRSEAPAHSELRLAEIPARHR
jgi:hypothetical protein